jgi:hypothetical protein
MAFLDVQRRPEKTCGSYARSRVSTTDATTSERACLLGSTAARQSGSGYEGFDAAAQDEVRVRLLEGRELSDFAAQFLHGLFAHAARVESSSVRRGTGVR